jgi:hypothetical protein
MVTTEITGSVIGIVWAMIEEGVTEIIGNHSTNNSISNRSIGNRSIKLHKGIIGGDETAPVLFVLPVRMKFLEYFFSIFFHKISITS